MDEDNNSDDRQDVSIQILADDNKNITKQFKSHTGLQIGLVSPINEREDGFEENSNSNTPPRNSNGLSKT